MNFVAGLLLQYLPERHAFGGLVVLMQDRGLRKYYSTDLSLLQVGGGGVERGLRRGDRCFRHHRPVPAASGGEGRCKQTAEDAGGRIG